MRPSCNPFLTSLAYLLLIAIDTQDGTYNIEYDDGEKEYKVNWSKMKTPVEGDQQTAGSSAYSTPPVFEGMHEKLAAQNGGARQGQGQLLTYDFTAVVIHLDEY